MRYLLFFCLLLSTVLHSQNATLAKNYFQNGEYEKALIEYKNLYAKSSSNMNYISKIISTHQQLEQYDDAEIFILDLMKGIDYPAFFVELGYNFQLKNNLEKAQENYQKAIAAIDDRASHVFAVARSFQEHSLLEEAVIAYEKAAILNKEFNFDIQLAKIYGEQGNIEKMFNSYVNFIESTPSALRNVKRSINEFITEDGANENNIVFRKMLLKKMQQEPNIMWNDLLSWLFIQQKDFKKAFTQEKAIYKRQPESLNRIKDIAVMAKNENQNDIARTIFSYIIETSQDDEAKLEAQPFLKRHDLELLKPVIIRAILSGQNLNLKS